MDTRADNLIEKIKQEIGLIDMIEKEIIKTTFHHRARIFINSLIRQRQLMIDRRVSLKNPYEMLKAIDHLKVNLDATGSKDRPMARYFLLNEEEIRGLIPGTYPNKRFDDFIALRDQAREINNRQLSMI